MGNACNIRAPFRLDLVMGGVSDLEWWSDKPGDCISVSCDFHDVSIDIDVQAMVTDEIICLGFGRSIEDSFSCSVSDLCRNRLKVCPSQFRLIMSSLIVAKEIIEKRGVVKWTRGIRLINNSGRAKGMGGSSVVAASIIFLLCDCIGKYKPDLQQIVNAVMCVEKIAGIGGGWEDIAGVYNSGINWIRYRPEGKPKLTISSIVPQYAIVEKLSRQLLVIDSKIMASTEEILDAAEMNYKDNFQEVIFSSDLIRRECDIVNSALTTENLHAIGLSLQRQRYAWNYITKGKSASMEVDLLMQDVMPFISGYREAGAGGGGSVLVMCKDEMAEKVGDILSGKGCSVKLWKVSQNGISIVKNIGGH